VLDQLRSDSIAAMKAGEKERVGALRLVISELQKDAKEGSGDELAVLRRERKRRLDAAAQFGEAGRTDLAEKETAEAELISAYLPAEMSDEQLRTIVTEAIAEAGATSPSELGSVMKLVMARTAGQVDGKRAQSTVREALT
jgi:hypothetical protein